MCLPTIAPSVITFEKRTKILEWEAKFGKGGYIWYKKPSFSSVSFIKFSEIKLYIRQQKLTPKVHSDKTNDKKSYKNSLYSIFDEGNSLKLKKKFHSKKIKHSFIVSSDVDARFFLQTSFTKIANITKKSQISY